MTSRQVARLLQLSQLALDECRRDLAAADSAVASLERSVRGTREQRALAVEDLPASGVASVGRVVATLDVREERLTKAQARAAVERDAARRLVASALQRARTLERLHEIRSEREALALARRDESEAQELAAVLRFRAARLEGEDGHET